MSDEDRIMDFFRNPINECKKITLRINIPNLKSKIKAISPEGGDILIDDINLLAIFFEENTSLFKDKTSYFEEWKLSAVNPLLPKKDILNLFKELNVFYDETKAIVFEAEELLYYIIKNSSDRLIIEFYYVLETNGIVNLKKDINNLKKKKPSIFDYQETDSNDITYNSFLYPIFLKKYYRVFTKQDSETYDLLLEISNQFLETFSERREYKTISIIALAAIIIENNLIKIYLKHTGNRPSEKQNINGLNSSIAKNETLELRHISGNNYQLISKTSSNTPYTRSDKIYVLVQDFANNIRNKVFHFQQSSTLNLFYTSVHALKYFVNILMEIEDNEYL